MIGTNETNFQHDLLCTDRQVSSACKAINKSRVAIDEECNNAVSVLIPLGLAAAASAADARIYKKILGFWTSV